MINRILIRIKVVQILYSYLLARSEFKIETVPDNTTRDKKYAYSLYFDFLLLILKLSGYNINRFENNTSSQFELVYNSKLAKALIEIDEVKNIIAKNQSDFCHLDSVLNEVFNIIKNSSAYKDFKKIKQPEIKDEVKLWSIIFHSIILKNESFIDACRINDNFTIKGYEMGINLIVDTLLSYSEICTTLSDARKSLYKSLDKSYELYFSIFKLMIDLTQMQYQRIDAAKTKYLPTIEDLNPNTRFIENRLIQSIENNQEFKDYIAKNPINWSDDPIYLKSILDKIISSDIYLEYMNAESNYYADDCNFWRNILKNIIFNDDDFHDALETKSSYWNDDLHIIGTFVLKTIKQFSNNEGENASFIPQFKDKEDADFGPILFAETINNFNTYRGYIEQFISKQWDSERLAFMDIIIMTTAIAEMIKFPLIPIPVTLNEYIEIANNYSTAKSGQFINGILYSVINYLKEEGILNK